MPAAPVSVGASASVSEVLTSADADEVALIREFTGVASGSQGIRTNL